MNDASDDQIHRLTDHFRAKIQEPSSVVARQASGRDQLILCQLVTEYSKYANRCVKRLS